MQFVNCVDLLKLFLFSFLIAMCVFCEQGFFSCTPQTDIHLCIITVAMIVQMTPSLVNLNRGGGGRGDNILTIASPPSTFLADCSSVKVSLG